MRMLVCSFTDLVLVCVPLLELSCCCSFAKAETKTRIKVVFITLTTKVIKTQLKLCYQYIHCKRKKYGLSDLLFPNSKWFWPCPHVSGYSVWIRILFFPDMPFIHTHPVNPTCESRNFWIRYFFGYVWTVESGNFRIRWRCMIWSSLYSHLNRVATKQHGSLIKMFFCFCWAESSWQD